MYKSCYVANLDCKGFSDSEEGLIHKKFVHKRR